MTRSTLPEQPWRPTKAQLKAAEGKTLPDLIKPGLKVLFCGINPGLYTAAIGHHFGRPGNRFWPALYAAGFTPRLLSPFEERELLDLGYGIVNVVNRATTAADELAREEIVEGGRRMTRTVLRYKPKILAVLGIGAYRAAFNDDEASVGPQSRFVGSSGIWVLPNPSGLNAHFRPPEMAKLFRQLRIAAEQG